MFLKTLEPINMQIQCKIYNCCLDGATKPKSNVAALMLCFSIFVV